MNRPLILDYSISRVGDNDEILPYFYDYHQNLNVIICDGERKPVVLAGQQIAELLTKTENDRERDDEGYHMVECETITKGCGEGVDAESVSRMEFIEMETITRKQNEGSDDSGIYNIISDLRQ